MIGSCCDYVKCNLDVFVVYEMIEGEDFFEIEDFGEEFIKFLILLIVFVDEKIVVFVGSVVWDVVVDQYFLIDLIVDLMSFNCQGVCKFVEWCFKKDDKGNMVLGEL